MVQRFTAHLNANQGHPPAAIRLALAPAETQISAQLSPQLHGEFGRQQPLITLKPNPLQSGAELQFRPNPPAPALKGDATTIRQCHLQGHVGAVLIQANRCPACCPQRQASRCNLESGLIRQTDNEIHSRPLATLRHRTRHPVGPLRIPAKIQLGALDAHGHHRAKPLNTGQRVQTDRQPLDRRCGLIKGTTLHLDGTDRDPAQAQPLVGADADRVSQGLAHLLFKGGTQPLEHG